MDGAPPFLDRTIRMATTGPAKMASSLFSSARDASAPRDQFYRDKQHLQAVPDFLPVPVAIVSKNLRPSGETS